MRKVVGRCMFCKRQHKPLSTQVMAPLPPERVTSDNPPFDSTGIDYFGPLNVRLGRSTVKRWGVIFTCMSCRAVHFEVSHSLDTDSFLAAFSRFVARRGLPRSVFSDNGTNMVAAEKELKGILENLDENKIRRRHDGITWTFIPPSASHMAGAWERLIRSTKTIMRGLLEKETKKLLSDEGLYTLLCEIERIMNDRPLTANPTGIDDAPALTPSMLLTFRRRTFPLSDELDPRELYSKRWWRHVQHLSSVFWRRWKAEYIPSLLNRQKWNRPKEDLKKDDIVLIADVNTPRGEWPLGRITELLPGADGHVRTVKVLFNGSEKIRPIHKLCLLEHHN